jgi:amidase
MSARGIADPFASATALLAALRARQVSAVELPFPATPAWLRHTVEVNGQSVPYELGLAYAAVSTVAGQPATAFPVGLTRAGLPIGLQAIGPYLEDRTPMRFAALLAREWGGFQPPPGYEGDGGASPARG